MARWLLQSGLRCVLARASVRTPAPEWWDDVFGPKFAHELVEERLVLIGGGGGGALGGAVFRVRRASVLVVALHESEASRCARSRRAARRASLPVQRLR